MPATKTRSRRRSRPSRRRGARPVGARMASSASRRLRDAGSRVGGHLSPRTEDAIGIALLVVTGLCVLGLWLGAGGPFGTALQAIVLALFGPVGYALPVLALYWAVLMLKGTVRDDRGRMLVGLAILSLGVLGIASIVGRNPDPTAGYAAVKRAGGAIGSVVGWPLSRAVSAYGAVVVCLGFVALGVLVFTATPLSAVGRAVSRLVARPRAEDEGDDDEEPRRPRPHLRAVPDRGEIPPGIASAMPEPDAVWIAEPKQIRLPVARTGDGYKLP